MSEGMKKIPWGKGIFRRTKRITFALSNICNLADEHKRCPLSDPVMSKKTTLPTKVILETLEIAKKYDFRGCVGFHWYNEPTLDPRLSYLLKTTKEYLPHCTTFITTNGTLLTRQLVNDLIDLGLDWAMVSIYSKAEDERLRREGIFKAPINITGKMQRLDGRLNLYGRDLKKHKPCYAPLYELMITHDAKLGLCCFDWKQSETFGSLLDNNIEELLQKPEIWDAYERLSKANRFMNVCKGCSFVRGEPPKK